jgi:hypothetical protein
MVSRHGQYTHAGIGPETKYQKRDTRLSHVVSVVLSAPIRCACGETTVIAVEPGADPAVTPGGIAIAPGVPTRAWCIRCAPFLRAITPNYNLTIAGTAPGAAP